MNEAIREINSSAYCPRYFLLSWKKIPPELCFEKQRCKLNLSTCAYLYLHDERIQSVS